MKVLYENIPVDVSNFINVHPGGPDWLYEYEDQEIKEIFEEYQHSESALQMLKDMQSNVDDGIDVNYDIVDMNEPLLPQLFNLSKKNYLYLIHNPQHLDRSVRLFRNNILEMLGRTYWFVVPLVWLPVIAFSISQSPFSFYFTLCLAAMGIVLWSFIEYVLHRFVFHCDKYLPDNGYFIVLHYLLHGIHHLHPMDPLRLVMPPILTLIYSSILFSFSLIFIPFPYVYGLYAGTKLGYVIYDVTHYWLHHLQWNNSYFLFLKSYHLKHHYKNPALGFGITSTLWDKIFYTLGN
eukprot:NODE_472_length_8038_cov_0.413150.p3 type:complete len:292 gc:universal NODE_472_length_8038_cov_0.413150:7888-7013(-)